MVESFPHRRPPDDHNKVEIYSFILYKCPQCSYLEMHDEG